MYWFIINLLLFLLIKDYFYSYYWLLCRCQGKTAGELALAAGHSDLADYLQRELFSKNVNLFLDFGFIVDMIQTYTEFLCRVDMSN